MIDFVEEDGEITRLLKSIQAGDTDAQSELVACVYDRLHAIVRRAATECPTDFTLGPTALLHEGLLRLLNRDVLQKSPNRRYFFSAAARAIRQALVDHIRRRKSQKRGGDYCRVPLDDLLVYYERNHVDLVALDELLEGLEAIDVRKSQVVHLRVFAGLTMPQIAAELDVSLRTVETDWQTARAFLRARWPS